MTNAQIPMTNGNWKVKFSLGHWCLVIGHSSSRLPRWQASVALLPAMRQLLAILAVGQVCAEFA
jgi:hypothetical protein